jgi:hypothetical protein
MFLDPSGVFYGTTSQGGANAQFNRIGRGVFYGFSNGQRELVILQYPVAKVGSTIGIFGRGLTGATGVSFNGKAASFTVMNDTYLTATVPAGSTKGFVTVTTPSGAVKSLGKFKAKP